MQHRLHHLAVDPGLDGHLDVEIAASAAFAAEHRRDPRHIVGVEGQGPTVNAHLLGVRKDLIRADGSIEEVVEVAGVVVVRGAEGADAGVDLGRVSHGIGPVPGWYRSAWVAPQSMDDWRPFCVTGPEDFCRIAAPHSSHTPAVGSSAEDRGLGCTPNPGARGP